MFSALVAAIPKEQTLKKEIRLTKASLREFQFIGIMNC
jgi:hypothetical protein